MSQLLVSHNVLYAPEPLPDALLMSNFCGVLAHNLLDLQALLHGRRIVYLTGALDESLAALVSDTAAAQPDILFWVVHEYASNCGVLKHQDSRVSRVFKDQLPINVHGVGVQFRCFFDSDQHYFERVQAEHKFQELTESDKGGVALRKGIYLSNVVEAESGDSQTLSFHMLRCSSNLRGPTDNFRTTDHELLAETNGTMPYFFSAPAELNHVLAQIYYNKTKDDAGKESKAAIKRHSDKTKDMPANGLIAFATFYDFGALTSVCASKPEEDPYDVYYRGRSGREPTASMLTQLEFVLKNPAAHPALQPKFRVTLYPGSLFVIPLETNRLYTHEIKPPVLPADKIPTRLGYVMRCSKTRATFWDDQTYVTIEPPGPGAALQVLKPGTQSPGPRALQPMTPEDAALIKDLYFQENTTDQRMTYPPIYSSFNSGDYMRPLL